MFTISFSYNVLINTEFKTLKNVQTLKKEIRNIISSK